MYQPQQPAPTQQPPQNPGQNPAIALFICAVAMGIGMFTNSWATAHEGRHSIGAGLFHIEGCRSDGGCESLDWARASDRLDIPSDVDTFRTLGIVSGFAALAALVVIGGMLMGPNLHKIPLIPLQIPMGLGAGCLTYFAFRLAMSDRDVSFGPGYSAFLTIGALLIAGTVVKQWVKPIVEEARAAAARPTAMYPPPPPPPPPATHQLCPRCRVGAQWVPQYQRWYCNSCQGYL